VPDSSTLAVFCAAAAALLVTPGPAVLYIVACSLDRGRAAGLASTVGIGVGTLFHVAAAALGLSALLRSSPPAFAAVRYLGAGYLIYLGLRRWSRSAAEDGSSVPSGGLRSVFYRGILVNVLNPKAALFFLAFLPQFVDPARGPVGGQVLFLGAVFAVLAVTSDTLYALLAGSAGEWLRRDARFLRAQRLVSGGVFFALGLGAALSGVTGS